MKKTIFLISACLGLSLSGFAQDYEDDIYYNPKKASAVKTENKKKQPAATIYGDPQMNYYYNVQSAYQTERDVDEYNRRGLSYYQTPIDTIGEGMANSGDFLYTQQIQKYYNPTIVVDNASLLADVLDNSYGNVDIIYANGNPMFSPWSYSPWYYSSWYSPWYYPSSYYWGWGPSWGIGWSWGWGPGWFDPWYHPWHPGCCPGWGWGGNLAWRPSTPRPSTSLRPGWSGNTRPSMSTGHRGTASATTSVRPGVSGNPGYTHRLPNRGNISTRPGSLDANTTHRYENQSGSARPATRPSTIGGTTRPSATSTRPGSTQGYRPSNGTSNGSHQSTRPSNSSTRPSNNNNNYNRPSYNTSPNRSSGSFNSGGHRGSSSSGGFRSGGSSGGFRGGGGGGGHRR